MRRGSHRCVDARACECYRCLLTPRLLTPHKTSLHEASTHDTRVKGPKRVAQQSRHTAACSYHHFHVLHKPTDTKRTRRPGFWTSAAWQCYCCDREPTWSVEVCGLPPRVYVLMVILVFALGVRCAVSPGAKRIAVEVQRGWRSGLHCCGAARSGGRPCPLLNTALLCSCRCRCR